MPLENSLCQAAGYTSVITYITYNLALPRFDVVGGPRYGFEGLEVFRVLNRITQYFASSLLCPMRKILLV